MNRGGIAARGRERIAEIGGSDFHVVSAATTRCVLPSSPGCTTRTRLPVATARPRQSRTSMGPILARLTGLPRSPTLVARLGGAVPTRADPSTTRILQP